MALTPVPAPLSAGGIVGSRGDRVSARFMAEPCGTDSASPAKGARRIGVMDTGKPPSPPSF